MRLSTILNELPKKIKRTLTRKELDSIFQAFFFDPQQRSDSTLNMLLEKNDTDFFYGKLFYIDEVSEYNPKGLSTAKAYARHLKKILKKDNYFIYVGASRFISDWGLVIVINEDMVQDDVTEPNRFFMEYDDEPMLYDIRVYSVY